MSIPLLSSAIVDAIDKQFPGYKEWYTGFINYMKTKFDTQGDIRFLTAGKGLYIISPDGTKYYATMDNAGAWDINPE